MQTIGERLEEARKRKGISIREAAEATKIRGEYLQKFENNQFEINLSDLYVRGFLRTYANFLKLPAERLVSDFCALHPAEKEEERPRIPSREVYGRMDISVTSSNRAKSADTEPEPEPVQDAAEGGSRPRTFARIGTSLPAAPLIEGRMVIKIGVIAAAALLIVLIIWGIMSVTGGSKEKQAQTQTQEPQIVLYAIDTVRVKVVQASDNQELFQGTLVRGEQRKLPKRSNLFITYSEGKNLQVEVDGKRYPMPTAGYDRAEIK